MEPLLSIVGLGLLSGATIPMGGFLAKIESIHPAWLENEFRHFVIAFGGGALIAAVALVLIPHGMAHLSAGAVVLWFLLGSFAMIALDIYLARSQIQASNLVAMLSDFLPEALALGATFSSGSGGGLLLALLIAMQNMPEGFNAYREMMSEGKLSSRLVLRCFMLMALLGPLFAGGGYYLLRSHVEVVAAISVFAAGGILYIVFGDIAPQAKLARRWAPPLGAVSGFILGVLGQMLLM
ncbi:MAG TPA: divalent cation transporter [Opitutae bacterium]|nr:divalent cation transporter [Puniceicoccaceae bacterium]HBR95365.1 divalent cation transporter [Opitutae bacterium]|tara:strand:- start:32139 stop:32852 length:714 start_codon:yes stop_codon:yes gene_type:complete